MQKLLIKVIKVWYSNFLLQSGYTYLQSTKVTTAWIQAGFFGYVDHWKLLLTLRAYVGALFRNIFVIA